MPSTLLKSRRTRAAKERKQSTQPTQASKWKKHSIARYKPSWLTSSILVIALFYLFVSHQKHPNKDQDSNNPIAFSPTKTTGIEILVFDTPHCNGKPSDRKSTQASAPLEFVPAAFPKSALVLGGGLVEVYSGAKEEYKGTIMAVENCVDFYDLLDSGAPIKKIKFILFTEANTNKVLTAKKQVSPQLQQTFATINDLSKPHTRIVFSATSSEYFGYQVYANALGFKQSNQTYASWLRLLSSSQPDDLSERFPTFTAPRSIYSDFYHPINKADVIDKWMISQDAPHPDDTIVIIDPDSWLINNAHNWVVRASPKKSLAHIAYFSGNKKLHELWAALCRNNCNQKVKPAAVPYVIKASDLKQVAPLWRSYSIDIKERFRTDPSFKENYGPALGVGWAAEMFGWIFATTELGIETTIVQDFQIRDVDGGKRNWEKLNNRMPMIHMGRAWFPPQETQAAAPWRHSIDNEPEQVKVKGIQVWCKCNTTAAQIQPWPLPKDMDFVSYHTLRLLHESTEVFGPIPTNERFRKKQPVMHHWYAP